LLTGNSKTRVTEIISGLSGTGEVDRATAEDLFPVVYDELRRLAKGYMSRETPGHTLQPTALVHEARGAGWQSVTLSGALDPLGGEVLDPEQLLDLNAALEELAEIDEREARVVTLRFFGGLTMEQVAEALGVSKRTVENDWRHAQAWLRLRLSEAGPS
jgi:RNA polymerase sigma factor (sigma-70 family)